MGDRQATVSVAERPAASRAWMVFWGFAAVAAHAVLLDAAIETFVGGAPGRWLISPVLALLAVASAWAWRPGGRLTARLSPAGAAWTPAVILLGVLAVAAWRPGSDAAGVRLAGQSIDTILIGVVAIAVCWALVVALPAGAAWPRSARVGWRVLVAALGIYALASVILGVADNVTFGRLFDGAAAWQAVPRWLQGTAVATFFILPIGLLTAFISGIRACGVAGLKRTRFWTPVGLALALAIALSGYYGPPRSGDRPPAVVGQEVRGAEAVRALGPSLREAASADPAAAAERVRFLLDEFARLRAQVPRDTFDPQAVLTAVGSDPVALFTWVRDNTFWVPYRGALRGPTGVLMDRLGSSLDRSLLLADVLRLAGRKARLAHAQLSPAEASSLLARVRAIPPIDARRPVEPESWQRDQQEAVRQFAEKFSKAPEAFVKAADAGREAARADVAAAKQVAHEQAEALWTAVAAKAAPVGDDPLGAIADHWWVQYQQDGGWASLDPAASDAAPGIASTTRTPTVSDQPPPDSRWTVTISVVVESWSQGRLSERRVLTHRAAAFEAAWQDISLSHAPAGFPDPARLARDAAGWRTSAAAVREWTPVLTMGNKRVAQASFREDGSVNDRPGGQGGPALANPGSLFGALGGAQAPAAKDGVLTAEWVDYEIQGPGSGVRRYRRPWFDLVGPRARKAAPVSPPAVSEAVRADRSLSLLGETAIHVHVCRPSAPFLAERMLRRFVDNRSTLLALVPGAAAKPDAKARTLMHRLVPPSNALWRWASERFQASDAGRDVYVRTPGIATLRSEVVAQPGRPVHARALFDIVSNAVGVLPAAGSDPFRAAIRQGVADTVVEGRGSRVGNTSEVFRVVAAGAVPTRVIASRETSWSRPGGVSDDVVARIEADVASGHHVLVPEHPVTVGSAQSLGWWRVEAGSGTTVGVMDTGYHQGLSEYIDDVAEAGTGAIIGYIVADWVWEHTAEDRQAACSVLGTVLLLAGAALLATSTGIDVSVEVDFGK